jgi:hypothetical protein
MTTQQFQSMLTDEQKQAYYELYPDQKPKVVERWKPKIGQDYWCATNVGAYGYIWCERDTCYSYLNAFNCFPTKEEAQAEFDRTVLRRELQFMASIEDETSEEEWCYVILSIKDVAKCVSDALDVGCIGFKSKKQAELAIEKFGIEKLMGV